MLGLNLSSLLLRSRETDSIYSDDSVGMPEAGSAGLTKITLGLEKNILGLNLSSLLPRSRKADSVLL